MEKNPKPYHNTAFAERYDKWKRERAARYEKWADEYGMSTFRIVHRVLSTIICLSLIGMLLVVVAYLPEFGNPGNPANNEVVRKYIEDGPSDTGAINFVAAMILDYRAFDTLGEAVVLMTAACCVLILLRNDGKKDVHDAMIEEMDEPKHDSILQVVSSLLVPFVLVFGSYVVVNGHLSPGGGFSGGSILGAAFVLYSSAFGAKKTARFFSYNSYKCMMLCALMFYLLGKGYSFFMGANHLKSGIPLGTPGNIVSGGLILPLNICVGFVVACTIYGFFALFGKGEI